MKIAIIGTGISGLSAAYALAENHEITVYEKSDYIGGHSRTIDIDTPQGTVPVDTGFIVYNNKNYPLLKRLFEHLDVPVEKSNMSFGVSVENGWLEYGTRTAGGFFGQKRNLFRSDFWNMLANIIRFNAKALAYVKKNPYDTLGQCLDSLKMGLWFRKYYLLAMGGAIWSTPIGKMEDFPARAFVTFFENHGLLTLFNQPQWYTVRGGSRQYVRRLTNGFKNRIKTNLGVVQIQRTKDSVRIYDTQGNVQEYDHVICASHPDQTLKMLKNPTPKEAEILGAFAYQPNKNVVHRDVKFMPKRKSTWASWIYLTDDKNDTQDRVSLTYWMNNLQPLFSDTPSDILKQTPVLETLNPAVMPDADKIYDENTFHHPVFDTPAIQAQDRIMEIQGTDRISYCGAWQRNGFHEDGIWSAVRAVENLGVKIQW